MELIIAVVFMSIFILMVFIKEYVKNNIEEIMYNSIYEKNVNNINQDIDDEQFNKWIDNYKPNENS